MGGFPALPEEEAQGLLWEVGSLFWPDTYMVFCSSSFFIFHLTSLFLYFISRGLSMLKRASSLKEEPHRLDEEVQHLEMEGLGKMEVAVAGSNVEGFYGLLRGAISHPSVSSAPPPPKKAHHIPSATVSNLPHQEPTCVTPKVSDPIAKMVEWASEAASPTSEEALPTNMQPLCIQLGASKECTDAGLSVAKDGPSTSHAPICTHVHRVHLGVGLVCPSCGKSFFNPDTFWHHKKSHCNL